MKHVILPLLIFLVLIVSVISVDTTFFNGNLDTVVNVPLTEDSFLQVYCDENNDIIQFTTFNTTGQQLIGNFTVLQNNGCANEGDSTSAGVFNESLWVIGSQGTTASDVGFQIFNKDGSNRTSRIIVDQDVGAGNTNDIAVLESSQFVFCYVDNGDTDERGRCQVFDSDGNNVTSIIVVSNADANNMLDIAIDNINSSAYFVVHHETVGGQRTLLLDTYLDNIVVADEISVDVNIGTHSEYDVIAFDDGLAAIGFIAANQVDCAVVDFAGTILTPTTIIDASVSNNFENIQMAKINESSYLLGWTDLNENATNAVVLNKSCGIIQPQTQIFDDTEQAIAVASQDNNIGFCFDNIILSGLEAPERHRMTSNHSDFSSWDGICSTALIDSPPVVTLISPPDLTNTNITAQSLRCDVTDDIQLINVSLFHNASGTFVSNETSFVSGTSVSVVFNKTFFFNQTLRWNCEAFDNSSQSSFAAADFNLIIEQTFPPPPIIIPVVNISLLSPANNSQETDGTVTFEFFINMSSNVSLIIDGVLNQLIEFTAGNNQFNDVFFANNATIEWFANSTTFDVESGSFFLILNLTNLPTIAPPSYELGVCPITTSLQSTIFFMFMVLLAFIIMGIGFGIRNGLLGFLGALLLIILSAFFYACIFAVGVILTGLGIFMVSFFVIKGVKNFD